MNELAAQVGVTRVKAKSASPVVEAFVRRLEPRCQSGGLPERLRDAVSTYIGHGGVFSTAVLPPVPAVPLADASAASSCDRMAEADAAPAVMRHRLLEQGFRLKSKAFMLTLNSKELTEATWHDFQSWVERKCRELGARRWAACIELSEDAVNAAGGPVYHTHACEGSPRAVRGSRAPERGPLAIMTCPVCTAICARCVRVIARFLACWKERVIWRTVQSAK